MYPYGLFKQIFYVLFRFTARAINCYFIEPDYRPNWWNATITSFASSFILMCLYTIFTYDIETKVKSMTIIVFGLQVPIFNYKFVRSKETIFHHFFIFLLFRVL